MEAGEDLIQMEDIAVFDGVEFFFRKFFQIMYMEVAVKPDYRKKDNQKFCTESSCNCNDCPEKRHNADSLFEEAQVHFSGTWNQGADKK